MKIRITETERFKRAHVCEIQNAHTARAERNKMKQKNREIQHSKEAADLLPQTMLTTVEYYFVKNAPADY